MRTQKINMSFSKYSDADLLNKANHIVASMTNNPFFVNPVPTLQEVQDVLQFYSNALTAAAGLGRNNIADKNKYRNMLEQVLGQLGMWVMFTANGDPAVLTSSGYSLAKEPEPRYLVNPGNVTLLNGITSGEIAASVKNVATAGYLFQISDTVPAEGTQWNSINSSRSQFVFDNLTPGKQYWVRVAAVGSRSQVAYSTVATQFAQ